MIKNLQKLLILKTFAFVVPFLAFAESGLAAGDPGGGPLGQLLNELAAFIFGPFLVFLLAVAFIAFAWGVFKYFIADAEGDKGAAKSLMLWGILGFVLILILFGAVNLLVSFTGLGEGEIETNFTLPGLDGG